jgi:ATPase subunit of ABC transporter with duplicated ATPase domains
MTSSSKAANNRRPQGADHHSGFGAARRQGHRRRNLSKAYGDKLLIEDLNFKLPPGGIVGVIGPNGAGKSTLFKMITGQEKPDAGTIKVGETVHLGYVDQSRDASRRPKNVWEEISGGNDVIKLGKYEVNSAPMSARSTSRAVTSRRRSATSQAASATACIWPRC